MPGLSECQDFEPVLREEVRDVLDLVAYFVDVKQPDLKLTVGEDRMTLQSWVDQLRPQSNYAAICLSA